MDIQESQLSNVWRIKDICQGVCCELDNVVCDQDLALSPAQKDELQRDYDAAKDLIDKLTAAGFFNKSGVSDLSNKQVLALVNDILSYEEKNTKIVANIWEKEITTPEDFSQKDFKLCVKPICCAYSDIEKTLKEQIECDDNFVVTHLISNGNITLKNDDLQFASLHKDDLKFGLVYDVNSENFIAASDEEYFVSIKKDLPAGSFYTDKRGDDFLVLSGFGTKLKTPKHIIAKHSSKRFTQNNNAVVLDGKKTKPVAIFCYDHGVAKINKLRARLNFLAKKWGLPLITISMASFFRRNGDQFANNTVARNSFNGFVDLIVKDLNQCGQTDIWAEAKKLVGLNTNLRYNFIYKFSQMLNNHIKENGDTAEDVAGFIEKAFKKSVTKHNALTKAREISSGAPLMFPTEDTFIALPNEFIKKD